ncbi:MAG: hypothetical protein ABW196_07135 [Solirubrobacterales bacterium]
MLAHIVGVPLEEALVWTVPVGGLGLGCAFALARSYASAHWRRGRRPVGDRGVA